MRRPLNRAFLILALGRGLDAAILDPLDKELMATLAAARALLGDDPSCKHYLSVARRTKVPKNTLTTSLSRWNKTQDLGFITWPGIAGTTDESRSRPQILKELQPIGRV